MTNYKPFKLVYAVDNTIYIVTHLHKPILVIQHHIWSAGRPVDDVHHVMDIISTRLKENTSWIMYSLNCSKGRWSVYANAYFPRKIKRLHCII
jgi:hypothetical protein